MVDACFFLPVIHSAGSDIDNSAFSMIAAPLAVIKDLDGYGAISTMPTSERIARKLAKRDLLSARHLLFDGALYIVRPGISVDSSKIVVVVTIHDVSRPRAPIGTV